MENPFKVNTAVLAELAQGLATMRRQAQTLADGLDQLIPLTEDKDTIDVLMAAASKAQTLATTIRLLYNSVAPEAFK